MTNTYLAKASAWDSRGYKHHCVTRHDLNRTVDAPGGNETQVGAVLNNADLRPGGVCDSSQQDTATPLLVPAGSTKGTTIERMEVCTKRGEAG